jgi:DNA-binding transcriptional ArsR family regulator
MPASPRVMNLIGTSGHLSVQVSASLPADFLVSLIAFGSPESAGTFDVGSAWFDEVRTKASRRLLELLDPGSGGGHGSWGCLVGLALLESATATVSEFISQVEGLAPNELWLTMAGYHVPELREAAGAENYLRAAESDELARQAILLAAARFEEDVNWLPRLLARRPSDAKDLVTELLGRWYEEIFAEGQEERAAILARDAEAKRALAKSASPEGLIEAATHGLEFRPEPWIRRVILVPQISMRPWNILTGYEEVGIICYPVADESLGIDRNAPPAALLRLHKALSDDKRLRMLKLLAGGPASLQQLAERVGLAKSSAHHHLVILRAAGLVRATTDRQSLYSLRRDFLPEAAGLLDAFLEGRPS